MDAKARQDCVKEIGLLKVSALHRTDPSVDLGWLDRGHKGQGCRGPSSARDAGRERGGSCGPRWLPYSQRPWGGVLASIWPWPGAALSRASLPPPQA